MVTNSNLDEFERGLSMFKVYVFFVKIMFLFVKIMCLQTANVVFIKNNSLASNGSFGA